MKNDEAIVYEVRSSNKPIRRGQIRYCKLDGLKDSTNGSFIGKFRPCIIFQSNAWNRKDATVGIIPLSHSPMYSSKDDVLFGLKLNISGIERSEDIPVSYIGLNRIMFVNKWRISTFICNCPREVMDNIIDPYLEKRMGLNKKKRRGKKC